MLLRIIDTQYQIVARRGTAYCYQVQALSTGPRPSRPGAEARNSTLFRELADQDGRLMSQSNHPVRVWMPDSFIESETIVTLIPKSDITRKP